MMKRSKDDISVKETFESACMEFYGGTAQTYVGERCAKRQKLNDALNYIYEVKKVFKDQKDKYDMFIDVFKDFRAKRIDADGVYDRLKELLKGHNNLILGIIPFMPEPYKTTCFEGSLLFVNKVKTRFQDDGQVYKKFLDILHNYRKEHKTIKKLCHEMGALFKGHLDLINEFTKIFQKP